MIPERKFYHDMFDLLEEAARIDLCIVAFLPPHKQKQALAEWEARWLGKDGHINQLRRSAMGESEV